MMFAWLKRFVKNLQKYLHVDKELEVKKICRRPIQVDGHSCGPAVCSFISKFLGGIHNGTDILAQQVSYIYQYYIAVRL